MTTTAVEVQRRFLALDQADAQEDSFELSFSSEKPVPRQYGNEILSHRPGAVDLARLNDGAPLLLTTTPMNYWAL